jgi:hypothetical protein
MASVVDDRTFVIGLCQLFRQEMKAFEVASLLPAAEAACRELNLEPAAVPVEGYYAESPELTRFFRLVRRLQRADVAPAHGASPALRHLRSVLCAPAMGRVEQSDRLLPRTTSPFGEALETAAVWSVAELSRRAQASVRENDAGLVAVAAATGDAIALCVARETLALSEDVMLGGDRAASIRLGGFRASRTPGSALSRVARGSHRDPPSIAGRRCRRSVPRRGE